MAAPCRPLLASSLVAFLLVVVVVVAGSLATPSEASRAFFVFGDSLVDNGNNNYLATPARSNFPPYGIDYPTHQPTGRFSNGLNIPDVISEHLGTEPPLPYLSPELRGQRLLVGANFASAGAGILNDSGIQFLNIIRITKQLQYFEQYQHRLSSITGEAQTQQLVNQALVLISLGGNDFINNYYLVPYSPRSREFSLPEYVRYIISEYYKVLKKLHDLGARRVLVAGMGPLGCTPARLAVRSQNGDCDPELQRAATLFNLQLVKMVNQLNGQIGSDVFVAVNSNGIHMDYISNPRQYGFLTFKIACCGQGPYKRGRNLHSGFESVSGQEPLRVLGRPPSYGEGGQAHCRPVHDRLG